MFRKSRTSVKPAAALLSALLALFSVACGGSGYVTSVSTVFSTDMLFSVSAMGSGADEAIAEMRRAIDEVDASVNPTRTDSLITRFNLMEAGGSMEIDEHFFVLAEAAERVRDLTGGAFDVTIEPISKAWGVDTEGISKYVYGGEEPGPFPTPAELEAAAARTGGEEGGYRLENENGERRITKLVPGLTLDFGGLAKGYCTDLCRDIAQRRGLSSALISLSGNVTLVGGHIENGRSREWSVGVTNPRGGADKPQYVCGFRSPGDEAVVTSGDYERSYDRSNDRGETVRICHIIDPVRLMPISVSYDGGYRPTESYVISATVTGASAMLCDAFSTAVSVLGAERGRVLLESEGMKGVIFTSDGKYTTVGALDFIESESLYTREYSPL